MKRVREEEEEQGSEARNIREDVASGADFASTKVKLIRAQGECLGIKSR